MNNVLTMTVGFTLFDGRHCLQVLFIVFLLLFFYYKKYLHVYFSFL